MIRFGRLVVLVREYQEALDFYVGKLGLRVATDIDAGTRRYVHPSRSCRATPSA